jgi:hypothetical protein
MHHCCWAGFSGPLPIATTQWRLRAIIAVCLRLKVGPNDRYISRNLAHPFHPPSVSYQGLAFAQTLADRSRMWDAQFVFSAWRRKWLSPHGG